MPTRRRRVMVTETDDVARRLDLAAACFPQYAGSRSELLVALTEVAEQALTSTTVGEDDRSAAKQRLLARIRGIDESATTRMLAARHAQWSSSDCDSVSTSDALPPAP